MTALPFSRRLLSLDVFRGLAIAGMILVNSPGSDHTYAALRHADWHGWTPADFVFPSFLFIMGVSLAITLGRRLERGESLGKLWGHVLWRAVIIFILGLVINLALYEKASGFRIPGVMQRISICYLFAALFFFAAGPRGQGLAALSLLVAYWLVLTRVPVPGMGAGNLTPEGNLASYWDRRLLAGHLYERLYDPEGLLSTIPAVGTALFGVMAGEWLRSHRLQTRKCAELFAAGTAGLAIGLIWGYWFPINKHIWTSSYAVLTGAVACAGLALCYWIIEIREVKFWSKPFEIFGRNPLLAYFLSGLFYGLQEFKKITLPDGTPGNLKLWLTGRLFEPWLTPPQASLAYALSYTLLCLGLMSLLYRRRIFLRI